MAIDWSSVRKGFEDGKSAAVLAGEHGCKADTIKGRAKKEGWVRTTEGKAPEKIILESEPSDGVDGILHEHRELWTGIKKSFKGVLDRELREGIEELKAAKTASEVLANIIKGERQAWGIDSKETGGTEDVRADEIAAQMASVTISRGADEALDGE